jgi:hypothetical protein
MPTNLLRRKLERPAAAQGSDRPEQSGAARFVRLTVGRHQLILRLLETRTADVVWRALPLFSIAETWGESIHFETPLRTGRERGARLNVSPGDVCFWSEDERVVLAWGPTPISRPDEIRLMRPCNIWAKTIGDPVILSDVTPGEKVSLERAPPSAMGGALGATVP